MSWQATSWAKRTRGHVSSTDKLLLMILADYADPESNIAWPSRKILAQDAGLSERTITRCLKHLEDTGLIQRISKANQYQSNRYLLNVGSSTSLDAKDKKGNAKMSLSHSQDISGNEQETPSSIESASSVPKGFKEDFNKDSNSIYTQSEWFKYLNKIPDFDVSFEEAVSWVKVNGFSDPECELTASALAAKWGGPNWKYKDPWLTFQNWLKKPKTDSYFKSNLTPLEKRAINQQQFKNTKKAKVIT